MPTTLTSGELLEAFKRAARNVGSAGSVDVDCSMFNMEFEQQIALAECGLTLESISSDLIVRDGVCGMTGEQIWAIA